MKRTFICLLACVMLGFGVQSAKAQETAPQAQPDSLILDLETSLRIALDTSPTIVVANREIERKHYARREAQSGFWPSISASGTYNRTLKRQVMAMDMNGQLMEIAVGTDNNWNGGITLSLPLVAPTLWESVKLTAFDIELAVENARSSRISTISAVKQAYYALLLAKDSYAVLQQNYQNVAMNTENVAGKFEQGLASEYDKLRAEVQLKNQRPGLIAAESAIELSTMRLKALIGFDVDYPIIFTGNLADFEGQVTTNALASDRGLSLENNSDLRQMDLQIKTLKASNRLTKAAYLPTLALTTTMQYTAMNNNFKIAHYKWYPYSFAALSLNIPIFSGLKRQQQLKQNRINLENLTTNRLNIERNLSLSATSSLVNINNAIESLRSNKETVTMAEKAYAISKRQFEVGMATWLDLSSSELALTQSRLAYSQSIYDYLYNVAELDKVLGQEESFLTAE